MIFLSGETGFTDTSLDANQNTLLVFRDSVWMMREKKDGASFIALLPIAMAARVMGWSIRRALASCHRWETDHFRLAVFIL
jgi:hypothetical protein